MSVPAEQMGMSAPAGPAVRELSAEENAKVVQLWTQDVAEYERIFQKWTARVRRILKRYTDEGRDSAAVSSATQFNILWSNVQTLLAATYAKVPKADVKRRFSDTDPVGRVASLILERAINYEIEHYPDFNATMKADVLDRFVGGRGTAWARYEPHMQAQAQGLPVDGVVASEDVDAAGEQLDYECAPVDYVHWRDFGHTVCRTWEEVPRVWRWVYMSRRALVERFGEELGGKVPLDSSPEDAKHVSGDLPYQTGHLGKILEGWDKETKTAVWISKSLGLVLDMREDPMGFDGFFPCPKPIYATLTNESLVPIPDFVYYQDQANELDILADRIDGLIKALKVRGVYDASVPALARLFSEGENNTLIPVQNWVAFAEKGGLKGAIDVVDILPLAEALAEAYKAFEQVKAQIYELTAIADIIRGQTNPNETLGAQQLKSQYASLRLKDYQNEVARFASDLIRLKAQVMCSKFQPDTLLKIAAASELTPEDQALVPQAMQLLLGNRVLNPMDTAPNPLRAFRVEVDADTLVYLDEQQEKADRTEFLTAVGVFLKQAAEVAPLAPQLVPLLMEMLKFGVTGFRAGRQLEGVIDQFVQQMKNTPPAPEPRDPAADAKMVQAQTAAQIAPIKAQAEVVKAQASIATSQNQLRAAQFEAMRPQEPAHVVNQ